MAVEREKYSRVLTHFPGLVILIFGMVALYLSLLLMQSRADLNEMHNNYSRDIIAFQDNVDVLDQAYIEFIEGTEQGDVSNVKTRLDAVNDSFMAIQKYNYVSLEKNIKKQDQYKIFQYEIPQSIARISDALATYEDNVIKAGQMSLHIEIKDMDKAVHGLQRLVSTSFKKQVFSEGIEKKEKWLYWSVIAMGLSSFILIVLNSDKLGELKRVNSERIHAMETLKNRLSALDMAQDGILIIDKEENLSYINKSLCQINGIDIEKRDLLIGKPWLDIFSDSDREVIEEEILPALIENGHWKGPFSLYRSDNSVVYADISFTKLPDGGGIGTIQDISGQQKSEDEKKVLEEQFYQAQKMEAIGRLAGGVAHDFNNILAAMNGYTEFLIDDLEDMPEQQGFARNILQAGLQARNLVDQMLAFSRRGDSTLEPLDIVESVSEAVSMLRATLSKTIELRDDFQISNVWITGNATQIAQLVMNLCVNARDAMEGDHGYLDIEIKQENAEDIGDSSMLQDELPNPKDTPAYRIIDLDAGHSKLILGHLVRHKAYVKLSVRDTGSGMSRVVMERIFEPFFTTKAVDKGTGLGLATVLGIVAIHQGFMVIDSTLGQGTCFDLYFPLPDDVEKRKAPAKESVTKIDLSAKSKSVHILLVEDQESVRGAMEEVLRRIGYDVSSVESGLEGLDIIRENPTRYDLILTDHNMPKMTGLELAQQVYLDLPDLPFILLSGYSEEKLTEIINGHPAIKAVLHKPVSREDLKDGIQSVLEKRTHLAA